MILGTGCLGSRALDGAAVGEALQATGLSQALLVLREDAAPTELAGARAAGVRAAFDDRERATQLAQRCRARRLILDLPESLDLEQAARGLHALSRSNAGLELSVRLPSGGPLAASEPLGLLLEDLAGLSLGYWHRPAQAHLLGIEDSELLDRTARHVAGFSLDDVVDGSAGLPPGLGLIDFPRLAALASPGLPVVLDVDPLAEPGLLRLTVETLRAAGF